MKMLLSKKYNTVSSKLLLNSEDGKAFAIEYLPSQKCLKNVLSKNKGNCSRQGRDKSGLHK